MGGSVYYPADDDGDSQPFNTRVKKHGLIPIVFMAHGNHSPADPSYLGYDYFQHQRAKMGIAAISHFRTLNSGDPGFDQTIDFSKVGLRGHSRGGDAVALVPEIIALPGV